MGWYSWSFKLTTTGITNKNRRGERMGPTLGQFPLNVPSNSALFPLPKFYSSSSPPLCQRSQKVQQQRYLGGHNTASCSIQFPLSLTHPFPIKDVWFSCVRVTELWWVRKPLVIVVNYQPSLSPVFQKRQLTLLVVTV